MPVDISGRHSQLRPSHGYIACRQVFSWTGVTSAEVTGQPILTLNDDDAFNFDILPAMGQIANDGAVINPTLEAAKNMVPGDWDSFTKAQIDVVTKKSKHALDPEIATNPVNVRAA